MRGNRGATALRIVRACPEAFYTNNGQQIVGWVADLDIASFAELINLYLINQDPLARGFAALAVFQHSLDDPEWLPLAENLRSEEHTSDLQSLMRISYAVFCLKKKTYTQKIHTTK